MKNLAIFASGSGTNAQNLIEYFSNSNTAKVKIIICNNPNAYVITRGNNLGIETIVLPKNELISESPTTLINTLQHHKISHILLAGYLLKIPAFLINLYPDKIINIHPALLPKFGGKGMYGHHVHQAVVDSKEKESGITIHLVDEKYDNGSILFQAKCKVLPTDTPDDVAAKIHLLEQENFPKVVDDYLKKEI